MNSENDAHLFKLPSFPGAVCLHKEASADPADLVSSVTSESVCGLTMVYPSGLGVYLVQHYPEWLTL